MTTQAHLDSLRAQQDTLLAAFGVLLNRATDWAPARKAIAAAVADIDSEIADILAESLRFAQADRDESDIAFDDPDEAAQEWAREARD